MNDGGATSAHPCAQRVWAWSHCKAELVLALPSLCSPEHIQLAKEEMVSSAEMSIFDQVPGTCSLDLSLLLCSSLGVCRVQTTVLGESHCGGITEH